jgi:hypothetical protein
MKSSYESFFRAYMEAFPPKTVFTSKMPPEMQASPVDIEGWMDWKPIRGTLDVADYRQLEKEFNIRLPLSFINWHRYYHFADCDWMHKSLKYANQPSESNE